MQTVPKQIEISIIPAPSVLVFEKKLFLSSVSSSIVVGVAIVFLSLSNCFKWLSSSRIHHIHGLFYMGEKPCRGPSLQTYFPQYVVHRCWGFHDQAAGDQVATLVSSQMVNSHRKNSDMQTQLTTGQPLFFSSQSSSNLKKFGG